MLHGELARDESGFSVASAGDVNRDGFADLIIGAPLSSAAAAAAGSTYVVFGRKPDEAVNRTGTDASQTLAGGDFNDVLAALGGADTLWGHGGDDSLDGGAGSDILRAGTGNDILIGGAGNDTKHGGVGIDTASHAGASGGVTVSLLIGTRQGGGGGQG